MEMTASPSDTLLVIVHSCNKFQAMAGTSRNYKGRYTYGGFDHLGTHDPPTSCSSLKGADQSVVDSEPLKCLSKVLRCGRKTGA